MATVRFFGPIRDVVGVKDLEVPCSSLDEVAAAVAAKVGTSAAASLARCVVWVNGRPPSTPCALGPADEVAYLSPVSGG